MDNEYKEIEVEQDIDSDEEMDENKDENILHPFNTKDIKVSNAVTTLSNIVKRLKYDEIDLNPDFQRNADLWDRRKMSRLIESIILRLPLPVFYFDVSKPDRWIVIDGLQRLCTIKKFIVDETLTLKHLEFLTELNNRKFNQLNRSIQRVIEETQINTYQIEPQTPKEVKYSIFNRINTGGMTLNSQEVRQALNQKGDGVTFLKEVVENKTFKRVVSIRSKRMVDRELVLRFIAFSSTDYKDFIKEKKTISTLLDEKMEMIDSTEIKRDNLNSYKLSLIRVLVLLEKLFEKSTLFNKKLVDKTKTATLNRSLFEVWTVLLSKLDDNEHQSLLEKKDILNNKYVELLKNSDFDDSITKGTNDKRAIKVRFEKLNELLNEVIK
jgi:hypothetical protein